MIAVLFPVLKSLSLAVLSFRSYAYQRQVQKGENNQVAILVGLEQSFLASILLETLSFVLPMSFGVYTLSWLALAGVPLVAAVSLGLLSMSEMLNEQLDQYPAIKLLIPRLLQNFPIIQNTLDHPLAHRVRSFFAKWASVADSPRMRTFNTLAYQWLGAIYFYGQAALFIAVALTVSPMFGLTGLGYFGLSALRSKAYLPTIVSRPLEKFELYVARFAGLFQANVLLKAAFFVNVAILAFQEIALPRILAHKLGKNSDFMSVVDDDKVEPLEDKLSKDISLAEFEELFFNRTNTVYGRESVASIEDFKDWFIKEQKEQNEQERVRQGVAPSPNGKPFSQENEESISLMWEESKDFYKQVYLHALNSMIKKDFAAKTNAQNENTWKNKILLVWSSFKMALDVYPDLYFFGKQLLTNMKVEKPLATTVKHLAQTPDYYLTEKKPQVNFNKFKSRVRALFVTKDGVINIASHKQTILKSVKFMAKANVNEKEQLPVDEINRMLLERWRSAFKLSDKATEDEILLEFMMYGFYDVCNAIETGAGLDNKIGKSIPYFQAMGTYVLAQCNDLMDQAEKSEKLPVNMALNYAEDIIRSLAVEAGDYCATAIYGMVGQVYGQYRYDILVKAKGESLSAKEKMQLYLQDERQQVFNRVLYSLTNIPFLSIFVDFTDRHVQSAILSQLTALNLPGKFNANSDLSNGEDFLSGLITKWVSYVIARLLMVVEHGYSPENIIEEISKQTRDGYTAFNVGDCVREWQKKFSPEIQDFIDKIFVETDEHVAPELYKKLYALMLYDFGVIEASDPAEWKALPEITGLLAEFNEGLDFVQENLKSFFSLEALIPEEVRPFVGGIIGAVEAAVNQQPKGAGAEVGNAQRQLQIFQQMDPQALLQGVASLANKVLTVQNNLEAMAEQMAVGIRARDGVIDPKEVGEFMEVAAQHSISMMAEWVGEQGQPEMQIQILDALDKMEGIGRVIAECMLEAGNLSFIDRWGNINFNKLMKELPAFVQSGVNRMHAFSIQSGLIKVPHVEVYDAHGRALEVFYMDGRNPNQAPQVEDFVREGMVRVGELMQKNGEQLMDVLNGRRPVEGLIPIVANEVNLLLGDRAQMLLQYQGLATLSPPALENIEEIDLELVGQLRDDILKKSNLL